MLGFPGRSVTVDAEATSRVGITNNVTARSFRGPFTAQPGHSLEDQIAELGHLVNRLREDIEREVDERERAISEERRVRQQELRAEARNREAGVGELRQELDRLREVTTGGVRLRWEGVPLLLVGVAFTTWPAGIAAQWPDWLPWRVLVVVTAFYAAARLSGALSTR
jgi:hypothetical protein